MNIHLFSWRRIGVGLLSGILALCLVSGLSVFSPAVSARADEAPTCNQYVLPVKLSPTALAIYHVVGWLCYRGTIDQYQMVQLLVHGGTYDHTYWDFPYQPDTYSYVRAMENAGYATFNVDRIGAGVSDHPLPELLTMQSDAYVIHQLVGDLRAGSIGSHAFQQVLLVGHSMGSAISIDEAATYADVDGVLLSGFLHFVDPAFSSMLASDVYPADLDPQFRGSGLLPGYLTTRPNTRGQLFYYLPDADPQVIATDEATKQTMTDSEVASFFSIVTSPLSLLIHVPVFVAVGQYDNIFCLGTFSCTNTQAVKTYESQYYAPQANLQLVVIPDAGHDLNLQMNASIVWFPQAIQWIQSTF